MQTVGLFCSTFSIPPLPFGRPSAVSGREEQAPTRNPQLGRTSHAPGIMKAPHTTASKTRYCVLPVWFLWQGLVSHVCTQIGRLITVIIKAKPACVPDSLIAEGWSSPFPCPLSVSMSSSQHKLCVDRPSCPF